MKRSFTSRRPEGGGEKPASRAGPSRRVERLCPSPRGAFYRLLCCARLDLSVQMSPSKLCRKA